MEKLLDLAAEEMPVVLSRMNPAYGLETVCERERA
jgi:hypothetical protein